MNNRGVAVGASWDVSADGYVPIAWPTPTTMIRLDGGNPQFALATAINDAGLIVGWGVLSPPGANRALLWKLSDGVPETVLTSGGAAPAK